MQRGGRVRLVHRGLGRITASLAALGLAACTSTSAGARSSPLPDNHYRQINLAPNSEAYKALFTMPGMVNAWGIAIRPKGAGGHFWVTAGNASYEFVGDVTASSDQKLRTLHQDPLKVVTIPGT